jgi:hypothetical protein
MLLVLASAIILGSESRGTHYHILLSQIREFPNLEGKVPAFISILQEQGGPVTPEVGVSFSPSPAARRSTVDVFEQKSKSTLLYD